MTKQTKLIMNDIEILQMMESKNEVSTQPVQTYRSPEVMDLGKASKLLQGGGCVGADSSSLTYCP
jgi:hypothetical protein